VFFQVLAGDAQHAARSSRGVVNGAHDAGLAENVVVLDEDEVDHQPDHLARGEVFTGGLVRDFRELADQFLEHEAHLVVVHRLGVQVDLAELLGHLVEQPALVQAIDLGVEVEALEQVAHLRRESLDVAEQSRGCGPVRPSLHIRRDVL